MVGRRAARRYNAAILDEETTNDGRDQASWAGFRSRRVLLWVALAADAAELERHVVNVDEHPITVWEKSAPQAEESVLLVHGRTWSALPDFDLQVEGEQLSLMDGLVDAGYAVYAVDLRGYGETPRDDSGWLTPARAAADVAAVLDWMSAQAAWNSRPHLFGWSMGSTISQLAAQQHPESMASLTLFGYWHDPDNQFPDDPEGMEPERQTNTAEAAASDFITPGSISQRAIDAYVAAALSGRSGENRFARFFGLQRARSG